MSVGLPVKFAGYFVPGYMVLTVIRLSFRGHPDHILSVLRQLVGATTS